MPNGEWAVNLWPRMRVLWLTMTSNATLNLD